MLYLLLIPAPLANTPKKFTPNQRRYFPQCTALLENASWFNMWSFAIPFLSKYDANWDVFPLKTVLTIILMWEVYCEMVKLSQRERTQLHLNS